jgi:1-pyrroline-5-carboxylate dehydrogenase
MWPPVFAQPPPSAGARASGYEEKQMLYEFQNEPVADFSDPAVRKRMEKSIAEVEGTLGAAYPLIIDGKPVHTERTFDSINPSQKDQIVGTFAKADKALAERAIEVAAERFGSWRTVAPLERARILWKAARIMRRRIFELTAIEILEESKNYSEGYADVAEAIDFLEFYGREMVRLGGSQPVGSCPGEENNLYNIPLGVGVTIPPWNFPMAILCGMTSAAIVGGNTVVLKPASASPAIGYAYCEIMKEAGLPDGVLNFVPGSGAEVGDTLVGHPKTRFIGFTGSKEVGLHIHELASKTAPGQIWIKRTILEMGGKDFILVDGTADLDAAAEGIVYSTFGFQGQKCSACSRAIATEDVYDEVLAKVVERTKKLSIGPGKENHDVCAVIDEKAYKSILGYIEIGKKEGRLVCGGGPAGGDGFFIQPTIIADVDRSARIAQEEIFGPVLAFIKARDFDDGIEIANGTEYGLTGSLYSNNRERLERGRWELHVGNLYFNRKCTGALVGVQPFGGFNMSGTDSKAGGRDYLLLFTQAKSVSERL